MSASEAARHRIEMARLREAYLREVPEKLASLRGYAARMGTKDAEAFEFFRQALHRLAGSAAIFGLPELSEAAQALDRRLRDSRLEQVPEDCLGDVEAGVARLEAALRAARG